MPDQTPDAIRNEDRENGGAWEGGYANPSGRVLIPFDLRKDIVDPLQRLETSMADVSERFGAHLKHVDEAVKGRMTPLAEYLETQIAREKARAIRMTKIRKAVVWGAGPVGIVVMGTLARLFGVSV